MDREKGIILLLNNNNKGSKDKWYIIDRLISPSYLSLIELDDGNFIDTLIMNKDIALIILSYKDVTNERLCMISKIKQICPNIPILLIYSICSQDNLIKAFKNGVRIVQKTPINSIELYNNIEMMLGIKRDRESGKRSNILCNTQI